jgi:hypothetical protein
LGRFGQFTIDWMIVIVLHSPVLYVCSWLRGLVYTGPVLMELHGSNAWVSSVESAVLVQLTGRAYCGTNIF